MGQPLGATGVIETALSVAGRLPIYSEAGFVEERLSVHWD